MAEKNYLTNQPIHFLFCDNCGSKKIIKKDFYVCFECGNVLREIPIYSNDPKIFENESNGKSNTYHLPITTGTQIGFPSERTPKFQYLNEIDRRTQKKHSNEAFIIYNNLAEKFDLSLNKNYFIKYFKKIYYEIPVYTKFRNLNLFCTTLFIWLSERNGIVCPKREILSAQDISPKDYYNMLSHIKRVAPFLFENKIDNNPQETITKKLIQNLAENFSTGQITLNLALLIFKKYKKYFGDIPRIQAASAFSLAIRVQRIKKIKAYHISKFLKIAQSTIYSRIKKVEIQVKNDREIISIISNEENPNQNNKSGYGKSFEDVIIDENTDLINSAKKPIEPINYIDYDSK